MEFFSGNEVITYIAEKYAELEKEINSFSDQQILACDIDEWADYYKSKYCIEPIVLYEDNIEQSISETTLKQYNIWHKNDPYEPEYYYIDGYSITFKIPFDGDEKLLYLRPSTRILSSFPTSTIIAPHSENMGSISITVNKTRDELKSHNDNMLSYVLGQFEGIFMNYRQMISYVNGDIQSFNNTLRDSAFNLLMKRKEKADDFVSISKALKIPLKMSSDVPNVSSIPLKRVVRKLATKPDFRSPEPEYCVSEEDYDNILKVIHSTCASMEAAAKTFAKNDEEELRDFIIATLGSHYPDAVSGETFRKSVNTQT